ncbi:MAG TPA: TetR/AcrR family transcriptional regulator [Ginsengibacter sp.]|nr:TetR/AcrR family transcriptional regulator [Ginsengibacter sp.]
MSVQSNIAGKKDAILKSTLELIKDNGFHGTPISMIAKHAGVASGTIYHYFPSKDAIIIALHQQIKSQMVAAMFTEANNGKEYKQQFFDGWINLCKYFINNPGALFFHEQFNSSPYAKIVSKKNGKGSISKFNEFFQSGMDKGYLKKMEYLLIASAVFGCITATAKYHVTGRFGFKDNDLCKVANIIWDGIKFNK